MNSIFQLFLVVAVTCTSTATFAQKSTQEILREIESSNRAAQIEMEQSRLRWQQIETESAWRHSEINRLRAETDLLRMRNDSQDITDRTRLMLERAELAATEQAEALRKSEEAAEYLRSEIEQSEVRTRNNIYLGISLIAAAGLIGYLVRKSKIEKIMQENQKFGIITIISSGLLIILAIVISEDWSYRMDLLQNIMSSLRIKLFADAQKFNEYHIDIPTKYVFLISIFAAAYGLTTYLGITPVPKRESSAPQRINDD